MQIIAREWGDVLKETPKEEDIQRREKMAIDLISSLVSQKRTDKSYGDTTLTFNWREGRLNKIDITDHVSYK